MKLGYARVSKNDQNLDRQIDELQRYGCQRIFEEKITGSNIDRPELNHLLDQLRKDDIIIITELARMSRSVKDLFALVDIIQDKGANLKSLRESWVDTTTAQGKLLFTVFAGISEFERDLISQRTREGLTSARIRGRKGGRPNIDKNKMSTALKMYRSNQYSIQEIVKTTGVSKSSLYRALWSRKNHRT